MLKTRVYHLSPYSEADPSVGGLISITQQLWGLKGWGKDAPVKLLHLYAFSSQLTIAGLLGMLVT